LLSADLGQSPSSLSPDDKTLLVVKGGVDIWALPFAPEPSAKPSAPQPVMTSVSGEDHAQLSPDGKWIAYTSDESKTREAYVIAFPGPGGKWQVSSGGASHVRWRSDGRELFYVTRGGDLMAAEVIARGDTLDVGRVQRLFGGILAVDAAQGYSYDVVLEGTSIRFIVAEGVERRNAAPEALTLVENWMGLLKTVPQVRARTPSRG
jgi:WD40-like Beta Propeller Repeat